MGKRLERLLHKLAHTTDRAGNCLPVCYCQVLERINQGAAS